MPDKIRVIHADSREALKGIAANSLDGCACDPPYALESIVERFGKPDAAPCNNAGTQAGHQNDPYARSSAGFMGQQWDTGETAFSADFWRSVLRVLKPGAHLVACSGTRTYHRLACAIEDAGFEIRDQIGWAYGSGFPKSHDTALMIDKRNGHGNRGLQPGEYQPKSDAAKPWQGWGTALKPAWEPICLARKPLIGTVADNVLKHQTGALNIGACRIESDLAGGASAALGRWPANIITDGSDEAFAAFGADRIFYSAKADDDDRLGSRHPTVKPVALMRYLVRMIAPRGATILDPFAGSGTTGIAAVAEGCEAILIEREAQFIEDIRARIAHLNGEGMHSGSLKARRKPPPNTEAPLFGASG